MRTTKRPRSRSGPYCIEEEREYIAWADSDGGVVTELAPTGTYRVVSRRGNLIIARGLSKFGALRGMMLLNGVARQRMYAAQGYRR